MTDFEEEAQLQAALQAAAVPDTTGGQRDLMACKRCGLVKAANQFQQTGCENCDPGMPMDIETMQEETTTNFSGMIAIMDPTSSWCARWTRKKKYIPGCYALKVEDEAPID